MNSSIKSSPLANGMPLLFDGKSQRAEPAKTSRAHLLITPKVAREWLDKTNRKNRPLSELKWMGYAIDMMEGRWQYNADTIRFGSDGVLLDGQHRLQACVEAGVPFESDVVFGLDPGVLGTIDIGEGRRSSEIAHLDGIENASNACALAQLLLIHRRHGIQRMNHWQVKPTKTQIVEAVRSEPRMSQVAGRAAAWGRKLVAPRVLTFCYFLFSEQDQAQADRFFEEFSLGANLRADSPVYQLRERLLANRIAKAKLPLLEIIALFFKAWIAFRQGRAVRQLRWRSEGPTAEKFPDITEVL